MRRVIWSLEGWQGSPKCRREASAPLWVRMLVRGAQTDGPGKHSAQGSEIRFNFNQKKKIITVAIMNT